MTAPDPRLEEIEGRLSKVPAKGESAFIGTALPAHATTELWNLRQLARDDVAYLLAELRKAQDKVVRVKCSAANWEARGEHDMAYSKTIPDEDIAMAILTEGASMVESARRIRNALRAAVADATGGERG